MTHEELKRSRDEREGIRREHRHNIGIMESRISDHRNEILKMESRIEWLQGEIDRLNEADRHDVNPDYRL